jgi:hypothetical protein
LVSGVYVRISSFLPVLFIGLLGCKSKVDKALNSPSVENANSLWGEDRTQLKDKAAALDAVQRDAWSDLFEHHLTELFAIAAHDPKGAIDDFCGFLGALAASPPARDKVTARLRALCDAADHARDVKDQLARRRSDAEDAVKHAQDDLKDATAQLKEIQSGARAVYPLSGMVIAALSDRRYEIAQFEARVVRNSYCAPGDDCSGGMALGVSGEHDILETTNTRFENRGRIDPPLCVRAKGEETVKVNGFNKRVSVYQEVDDKDCGAGQVASANKRVTEARAALQKSTNELQAQPLEVLATSDYTNAHAAVIILVKCVASARGDCLTDSKHDLDTATPPTLPAQPVPTPNRVPDASQAQPKSQALSADSVQQMVKAQAASLTSTGAAFIESIDANAVAFFPQSLALYEGREKIIDGSRDAWGHGAPDNVDASDVVVGIFPNFAWATAQWKITLSGGKTLLPVRVTEVLTDDPPGGLRVIAASFSIPPPVGAAPIGEPAPKLSIGAPPAADPDSWLGSPGELAKHLRNDGATVLIGSDARELALGTDESRRLLASWKNVKLDFVGNVRAIEGAGYRIVAGYARWRGPKPTLFRVLGLFVPGEVMAGPAPWELATVHYSVAVPATGTRTASTPTPNNVDPSPPTNKEPATSPSHSPTTAGSPAAPVQVYLVGYHGTEKNVIQFQVWEHGKLVLQQGPGTIEVVPGTPRTLVIRSITSGSDGVLQGGYRNKTLVVDGKTLQVEFDMEPFPNCRSALVDPNIAECRRQFCEINKSEPKCGLE